MLKSYKTPNQIVQEINQLMEKSNELDGDCKACTVRNIICLTDEASKQLGRNWNVNFVRGECPADCISVLENIVKQTGDKFDAIWT